MFGPPGGDARQDSARDRGRGRGRATRLVLHPDVAFFLRQTIAEAGGNEVFFLGRVSWQEDAQGPVATVAEVDVMARGHRGAVPAVIAEAEKWDISIHNHPGGHLEPSEADLSVAQELATRSVGFAIISNDAERVYLVVPPFESTEARHVDLDEVARLFATDGPLGRTLKDYEAREGQLNMALAVARSLNDGEVLAAEAGTGVGKSFAYLVPAILWALANKDRVVISTGTIHLQEQLVAKDLPFLEKALGLPFSYALIKGRSNYACLRKAGELSEELNTPDFAGYPEDVEPLRDLVEWAGRDARGSRSELGWMPPARVWERVMSETDKSLKSRCSHYQECFYYKAKRLAFKADILVVNHHLFFADMAVRRATDNYAYDLVLPAYGRVVFDEAHHLEDVASQHFGLRFSRRGVVRRLTRHYSPGSGRRGTVAGLVSKLRRLGDAVSAASIERAFSLMGAVQEKIEGHLLELEERLAFEVEEGFLQGRRGEAGGDRRQTLPVQLRYCSDGDAASFWSEVGAHLREVVRGLGVFAAVNSRALMTLKGAQIPEEQLPALLLELTSFGSRLEDLVESVEGFCDFDDNARVRWVETRDALDFGPKGDLGFAAASVVVARELLDCVYSPLKTVVLTSATLCVRNRIDFLGERLGLSLIDGERFTLGRYESPFDFRRQVLTVVPSDIDVPGTSGYDRDVPEAIYRIVRAAGGRAFVLFTSYTLLRRVHGLLRSRLEALGLQPLAQGEAERSDLLRCFRSSESAVLFGTDSFWEGVDVKGRSLECVIITRLPFRVPSEPLQEARMEEIERRGKHPFMSFTVPQAVLKFKQGFGRLVRSKSDIGVVAVLDQRLYTKRYGKVFLDSLPATRRVRAPLDEVVSEVERFFATQGQARVAKVEADEEALQTEPPQGDAC